MKRLPDQSKAETIHVTPVSRYLWVLAGLLALLTLSAGSALFKLGTLNTVLNMGISVIKTLLVMLFFMHETQARRLTRLTSALGFLWLAMLIGFALTDFLARVPVPSPW
ncbi:MAG: cytochrome C oxidase subunit IV family protein [Rhodanobacter sp.]